MTDQLSGFTERYSPDLGKPHLTLVPDPPHRTRAAEILDEAASLIDGDRDRQHGDRHDSLSMIAELWSTYLGLRIKPYEAAVMMSLLKAARTRTGTFHRDNYRDLAGYAAIAGELAEKGNVE